MAKPMIENNDGGITINKALAWIMLAFVTGLIWWGGGTLASLQGTADRLIKSGLDKLGHRPGTIDGRWEVRTSRALRQLIAANGRPASRSPQSPLP
jgi:hypothetical protein